MNNVATVTLTRSENQISAIMNATYIEEVRGYKSIQWTATHIVFELEDDTIIAYLADRVFEMSTHKE